MRSGLTLILSHLFAASRASLSDLFIQLCASLTAQATMGKLYVINYPPETGQPCYRLQIRNVQGYNEQVVGFDSAYNANHKHRRLRLKKR
jgi:hypothetical protein